MAEKEVLHEFEEGPYEILDYKVMKEDGKAVIEVNQGDLGRLVIENIETVEEIREALDKVEAYLTEYKRRGEEL